MPTATRDTTTQGEADRIGTGRHAAPDFSRTFLPDALTKVHLLEFLQPHERRLASQLQGRSALHLLALFGRLLGAGSGRRSGARAGMHDYVEALFGPHLPPGYRFLTCSEALTQGRSHWAVMALSSHLRCATEAHYRQQLHADRELCAQYKALYLQYRREALAGAVLDEGQWLAADARLDVRRRDRGIEDFTALLLDVDRLLVAQASADAAYFADACERRFEPAQARRIRGVFLQAYRWQHVLFGIQEARFASLLAQLASEAQSLRIAEALVPLTLGADHGDFSHAA